MVADIKGQSSKPTLPRCFGYTCSASKEVKHLVVFWRAATLQWTKPAHEQNEDD